MPIHLTVEAESVEEFDKLIARFSRTSTAIGGVMPEVVEAAAATPVARATGRKTKADTTVPAPTQNPDGTPIAPISEPVPQPTPGGTDAPPAESIPPNQAEDVAATPSASSPAADAAAAGGEVTVQNLKDAMAELLKAKSASFAMKTLEDATGCKSLTSGSPSVVEKAKDDPTIMRKTLDALVAAKDAA